MAAVANKEKDIVIIGGGIIGCSSAYYLTRHPAYDSSLHKITILEATGIASAASGKAGGLLALWAYPSNIVPLSYRLHAELAKEHDGANRWGYRRVHCGQLGAKGRKIHVLESSSESTKGSISLQKRDKDAIGKLRAAGIPKDLDWVAAESALYYQEMGDPDTTAQVHPYQFTNSMAELAKERGVEIIIGSVTKIDQEYGLVKSVTYTDKETSAPKTIPATDVILAAGPWTRSVFPPAPISALRAHSVTIRPSRPVSAYAIFTEIKLPPGFNHTGYSSNSAVEVSPEIYARPNNEVYACGEGDGNVPLPKSSDLVKMEESRCQDIVDYVGSISDELRDGEVTSRQACYLPNVSSGRGGPLIGQTGVNGLLMATGHTCWGIQNAPGTGKLISEFVFEGKAKSASIGSLDPRNYL